MSREERNFIMSSAVEETWKDPAGLARRVARRARRMLCAIPMLTESGG